MTASKTGCKPVTLQPRATPWVMWRVYIYQPPCKGKGEISMTRQRLIYFLGYIVFPSLLTLGALGFGLYAYFTQTALLKHGVKTEGTVLRFQEVRSKSGSTSHYKPDVEFEDANQQKHTVTLSCTIPVSVGQKFPVLYLPSRPQTAYWSESRALSQRSYRYILGFAVLFAGLPIWNAYIYRKSVFSDDPQ